MKNIVALFLLSSVTAALSTGCGGGMKLGSYNKEQSERQVQASISLKSFMDQNPDIAKLSLKEISGASNGGRSSLALDSFASQEIRSSIDANKASKAKELVGNVIDNTSFKDIFDAAMRIVAVMMNFQDQDMEAWGDSDGANEEPKGGDEGGRPLTAPSNKGFAMLLANALVPAKEEKGHPAKGSPEKPQGAPEQGRGGIDMTCQQVMDEPGKFIEKMSNGEIGEAKIEEEIKKADEEFKKQIGECPTFSGQMFADCTAQVSKFVAKINKDVNCSIKDPKKLEEILEGARNDLFETMKKCGKEIERCNIDMSFMEGDETDENIQQEGKPMEHGDEPVMEKAKPSGKAGSTK